MAEPIEPTAWFEDSKIIRKSDGTVIFCHRCPCCVSPRESTLTYTTITVTLDVNRTDVAAGPGSTTTYIGTVTNTYTRIPWVLGQTLAADEFSLEEYDCCPCRRIVNFDGTPGQYNVNGNITRTRPSGSEDFEVSGAVEELWSYADMRCKSSSDTPVEPIQFRADFDTIVPNADIHSDGVSTTVNGDVVDPDATGPDGSFYDGGTRNIQFAAGTTPCDNSGSFSIVSSIVIVPVNPVTDPSVNSTVTLTVSWS